jgi:hypothetical protein
MGIGIKTAEVIIPSPEQFSEAWVAFFTTVAAIALYRASRFGPEYRFGELAIHAADLLEKAKDDEEFTLMIKEMAEHIYEKVSLGILYEELLYISYKYKKTFQMAQIETPTVIKEMEEPKYFSGEGGDPGNADAIDDIEVVTSSVQKLLDKLPNWLRKAIEAIMEALKLTRGVID